MTKLLIARHGNTFGPNDSIRRVGITDLPLVQSGLNQAQNLGYYLKNNNLIPQIIFTSQLKRTHQTAQEILKILNINIPIHATSIFNEIDYGPDENQPEEKVKARIGEAGLKNWENSAVVPEGWKVNPEAVIQYWKDFAEEINLKYPDKIILVITSNGIARFAPYLTGNFEVFCKKHAIKISTGGLCIFEKNPKDINWNCITWNIKPTDPQDAEKKVL